MTEAGIRAALQAGAAGVIAKSVNENPAGGRQLDRADYVRLDAAGAPTAGQGVSLFNRSGLSQRARRDWFAAIAAHRPGGCGTTENSSRPASSMPVRTGRWRSPRRRGLPGCGCSN